MIEKIVLDYLMSKLDVPVVLEIPPDEPDTFVLIQKVGSSVENFIYSATLALQSYAASKYEAAVLNELVKSLMDALPVSVDDVTKSKLNSDYDFTDATTKRYRYQAVYDVVHY
mgnify:CR=1 FL=1